MLLSGACGDNAETQPLVDIGAVSAPSPPEAPAALSPEISSTERRSKYQNGKGKGEDTIFLGADVPTGTKNDMKGSPKNDDFTGSESEARPT